MNMKFKQIELSDIELDKVLNEFYKSFNTGYDFEQFLKIYLESVGLDELEVTQKSGDGGLDLKAVKKGIDELTDLDSIKYFVQAKRYAPNHSVSIESVRALRGILPDGYKGIFITTGKFSKKAYEFARKSESRPLILIDGKQLINNCIESGIGFRNKPVFHREDLLKLITTEKTIKIESLNLQNNSSDSIDTYIKKQITNNDIRARILRIPKSILDKIPTSDNSYNIKFDNFPVTKLKIDKSRTYFSGITEKFRQLGILDEYGNKIQKNSYWKLDTNSKIIEIIIEKDEK